MPQGPTSNSAEDWLDVAVRLRYLSHEQSAVLAEESRKTQLPFDRLAVEQGLLSWLQRDIVDALSDPGNIVPGYELTEVIGYGGLGIVYKARQVNLSRTVAVKTIQVRRLDQPGTIARFQQEAQAIGGFRHPNIVSAIDFGTHRDRLYLVMEYVEGEDLASLIRRRGRLDQRTSLWIARQLASALAHADQRNLVHRDVKPANVLLTEAPQGLPLPAGVPLAKITDFGLAFLEAEGRDTRLTMAGMTLGTPQYMAPEQFETSHVDLRADIYALGATLYHMLSGRAPFEGETLAQILAQRAKNDERSPDLESADVAPKTMKLVQWLMAHEIDHRPPDYGAVLAAIDEACSLLPDSASSAVQLANQPTIDLPAAPLSRPSQRVPVTANSSTQSTTELPGVTAQKRSRSIPMLVALGIACSALVALGAWGLLRFGASVPSRPLGVETSSSGNEVPLFDGSTLEGWNPAFRGSWGQARDAEGGYVLQGRATSDEPAWLVRSLPQAADGSALMSTVNRRIRVGVDLMDAEVAELHVVAGGTEDRLVIHFARGGARFQRRSADGVDVLWSSDTFATRLPATDQDAPRYHELRVERVDQSWQASLDSELIGTTPSRAGEEGPMSVGLLVVGGTANFEALRLVELLPTASDANRNH